MAIRYLEIVSQDPDSVKALYERVHGLSFGPPDRDLGQARVATQADGALLGIRKPLAAHEQPIMRAYFAVDDIRKAVREAEEAGATIAYPPTRQGRQGTFATLVQADVEHGLWQRELAASQSA
jgi:predicted enzyme related to lactoylglutathione lyase